MTSAVNVMGRPLIGLSTYRENARWGVWDTSADLLPTVYADAVEAVGGVPLLLPPVSTTDESAAALVSGLDGLVITGGADVEPARYAQEAHARTVRWRRDRDAWEFALLDAAESVALPVLGVCRGMQVMAVRSGGALDQHIPDLVGHQRHEPGPDLFGEIEVSTEPGSQIRSLIGDRLQVHCHHHQSVREHPGFVATAWADDGSLEAMEVPGDRFCVAVQWHPEMVHDAGLFRALVVAASER